MKDRLEKISTLYRAHITVLKLRHDQAMLATGFDHIVISAGAKHIAFLDDMPYPFKVNPHFKWWVPVVDNPHCILIYTPGVKPRLAYYQPVDYWHKPAGPPSGWWVPPFDIEVITTPDAAASTIPRSGRVAFIGEWDEAFKKWGSLESNPEELMNRLHYDRAWKTEYEIECLRMANEKSARGHVAAEKAFRDGLSEFEIHLEYLRGADSSEEELPYGNIIGLNDHASVLHYYHHDRPRLEKKDRHSFLIDAGAAFNGVRVRHHPHVLDEKGRVPRVDRSTRRETAGALRRRQTQGQLSGHPLPRPPEDRRTAAPFQVRGSETRSNRGDPYQQHVSPPRGRPLPRPPGP